MKTTKGEPCALEVSDSDTINSVLQKCHEQRGISVTEHRAHFAGRELDGVRKLSEFDIQSDATIWLLPPAGSEDNQLATIDIHVKILAGNTLALQVQSSDTVRSIKEEIQVRENIASDQQRLIFSGKQLDDSSLLSDCGVEPKSMLHMVRRIKQGCVSINVKMLNGTRFSLDVEPTDTVANVKEKISQTGQGIARDVQRLIFAGKQLDDTSTVSSYGIESGSTLHLVLRLPQSGAANPKLTSALQAVAGRCEVDGACGLRNLGNTCFLNSTLQALSNTVPLRRYYQSGTFASEISKTPLSMDGRLAEGFADLLKSMWENAHTVLPPTELKKLIAERRPEFGGYQQHDAQELLTFLLDGLHEDVNRAPYPRPIVDDPAIEGKEDATVAVEAWEGNLRRNCSAIVDTFQFQVRSEITFPDVGGRSLKFDPMMYLSLPLPKPPHVVRLTVVSLGYPEVAPLRCGITIPKHKPFRDLEEQLSQDLPIEGGFCLASPRRFVFCNVYGHRVYKTWGMDQKVAEVRAYDDVWAFEVAEPPPPPAEEMEDAETKSQACLESTANEEASATASSSPPALEHAVVQLRKRTGAGDFVTFAPPLLFAYRPGITTNAEMMGRVMASANRFKQFFGNAELQTSLTISLMSSSEEGSPLEAENNFLLNSVDQFTLNFHDLEDFLQSQRGAEDTVLRELPKPEEAQAGSAIAPNPAEQETTLEQCLEAFQKREELAKEDWVTCDKTKSVERSLKKLDIWSLPDCLIVHLKRFGSEMLTGPIEKIETLVKAPVDLDLSPWLAGPTSEMGANYRLYSVVNHSGTLQFGHYTAHSRVGEGDNRRWFHFNDSTVSPAQETEVVTKAAYILFYERVRDSNSSVTASSSP